VLAVKERPAGIAGRKRAAAALVSGRGESVIPSAADSAFSPAQRDAPADAEGKAGAGQPLPHTALGSRRCRRDRLMVVRGLLNGCRLRTQRVSAQAVERAELGVAVPTNRDSSQVDTRRSWGRFAPLQARGGLDRPRFGGHGSVHESGGTPVWSMSCDWLGVCRR
jgi:hypothetical protein